MNKEEAKKEISNMFKSIDDVIGSIDSNDFKNLIDRIYNDFESRTCKDCKHYDNGCCENLYINLECEEGKVTNEKLKKEKCILNLFIEDDSGVEIEFLVDENFSCNKFKRK